MYLRKLLIIDCYINYHIVSRILSNVWGFLIYVGESSLDEKILYVMQTEPVLCPFAKSFVKSGFIKSLLLIG